MTSGPYGTDLRLTRAVVEIEQHVAAAGWDQPPRLYALVETADLLTQEPTLAEQLGVRPDNAAGLTSIEQDELPEYASLEELLGGIAWPQEVLGTALVLERLMLPPGVEGQLPADDAEALDWVAAHPDRQEVRIAVAVLRDGSRDCALRMRAHDRDEAVLSGPDLVPGLADALAATLVD
jgi:hypothetical protein